MNCWTITEKSRIIPGRIPEKKFRGNPERNCGSDLWGNPENKSTKESLEEFLMGTDIHSLHNGIIDFFVCITESFHPQP